MRRRRHARSLASARRLLSCEDLARRLPLAGPPLLPDLIPYATEEVPAGVTFPTNLPAIIDTPEMLGRIAAIVDCCRQRG